MFLLLIISEIKSSKIINTLQVMLLLMRLFFQIYTLKLLIFCMDDQIFLVNFNYICLSFFGTSYWIIFLYGFTILLHLISSFASYKCISKFIDCICLLLLGPNAIFLISSINALCFYLLNIFCDFNINLLFFYECFDFLEKYLHEAHFFSSWFISFSQVDFLLRNAYNIRI